jgi:hypothetical protein
MRRWNEVTTVVVVVVRAAAAVVVGWEAGRRIAWRYIYPIDLRGQCSVCAIDALDRCGEHILPDTQLPGGRLQHGHLAINGIKARQLGVHRV